MKDLNLELLIAADASEAELERSRLTIDAAAKYHRPRCKFKSESIEAYIPEMRIADGSKKPMQQTSETRQFKVLKRIYE